MEQKPILDKDGNPITQESVEKVMRELFIDEKALIEKCEWVEDGQLCHTWKINGFDGRVTYTNDAGVQQLNDAIKRDLENGSGE